MTGAEMIAAERERQVSAEKWSARHDDEHDNRELALAAAGYCILSNVADGTRLPYGPPEERTTYMRLAMEVWPWSPEEFKPHGHLRNLARAGALIAAEIDRLQRGQQRERSLTMPLDHPAPPEREAWCEPPTEADLMKWHTEARCYVNGSNAAGIQAFRALRLVTALRRERDSSRRARLILAPHPGATPAEDTGCGCAVASLEELAVAVVERRDRYKASLDQFLRDTSEAMSCLPGCDSQAHEELCPVVNPAAAWRMLNADRDRYRAAIEQLETRPTDFTLDAEGNMEAVREYARLILAPPTPAAQAKGE